MHFEQMSRPTFIQIISIDILPVTRNITSTFEFSPGVCNSKTLFILGNRRESPKRNCHSKDSEKTHPDLRDEAAVTATQGQFQHLDQVVCRRSRSAPFSASENHDYQRKTPGINTKHPCIREKLLPSSYTWFLLRNILVRFPYLNHHHLTSSLQFCIGSHQPDRPEVHHPKGAAWILRSPVYGHSKHHPFSTNFWKGEDTNRLTSSLYFFKEIPNMNQSILFF